MCLDSNPDQHPTCKHIFMLSAFTIVCPYVYAISLKFWFTYFNVFSPLLCFERVAFKSEVSYARKLFESQMLNWVQ